MARRARLNLPDVPQHVIQRGNNRQATFFCDEDYAFYLDKLKDYADKFHVAVHAYILMTNHVHLLVTPTTKNGVSQMMQSLGRLYVRYINQTYDRSGTLWQGRYKSTLVDSERYLLLVSRYIELNPVRAGMVKHPGDYPWSSFQGNALDKQIKLLSEHPCYHALGKNDVERKEAYKALFRHQISDQIIEEIRHTINRGWLLGNEKFKDQIEQALEQKIIPKPHGGDRKSKTYRESLKNV